MKYGYARVSSKDQNESRQIENLLSNGIERENIFIDKQSGKDFNRPEYNKLINTLKEGDVIYIHSIDRLGRNYDMILEEWRRITKDIQADIVVLDMPLLNTTVNDQTLTGKFLADIVLQIICYVAETERNNIKKRQAEGIAIAHEQGKFVRKGLDTDKLRELKDAVDRKEITVSEAARQLGITRRTWYKRTADL